MKKSRRNLAGELSLYALFDYICFALRPRHDNNLFCFANGVNSHRYRALRHILQSSETGSSILPRDPVKIDQSSDAINWRWRLVESNMTSPTDTEYLDVDATIRLYLFFIIRTELDDIFPLDLSIGDVNIFPRDVNVVKKVVIHVMVVGLRVVLPDGVILIQIEGDYVSEA